jgi:hypothetical protein
MIKKYLILFLLVFGFHFANAQALGLHEAIELSRTTWPYILFKENGIPGARIQGVNGNFAITHTNGTPSFLTVNSTSGNVGIGTTSPQAKIEVVNTTTPFESAPGSNILLSRFSSSGGTGNVIMDNSWIFRDAQGSDWRTARLHSGISIDVSYLLPGTDTRTWWERAPFQDIQSFGTGALSYLVIKQGNIGLGTKNPSERLQVGDATTSTPSNISVWTNGNAGGEQSKLSFKMAVGGGVSNSTIAEITTNTFIMPGAFNRLDFKVGGWNNDNAPGAPKLSILSNGNVGIGTTSPDATLAVKGNIHTQEVKVDLTGAMQGPDYVFEKDYNLLPLPELESYINQNKHLPEVPSAKEMEANGLNLKEMNLILLKKVEELTLHLIEMKKQNDRIVLENQELKRRMSLMESKK